MFQLRGEAATLTRRGPSRQPRLAITQSRTCAAVVT